MRKKLLLSAMCVAMLCSLTACGKEEKKDDSGKIESTTAVATVEDIGEASSDTQVVEEETTETAGYITMSPDEVVKKLEEAGFAYSYGSSDMEDPNYKTHVLEYETEEAYAPAWVGYLADTEELTKLVIYMSSNSEEDLEKYNKLITMFFVDEADKQKFIDFVYKKDVREGLDEKIEIEGLSCYRQNMNVDNSIEGNDYKYCYNVSFYFK